MEIRTEKRVVEIEDKIYIAEDGKEFGTEADCRKYEKELEEQRIQTEAEKFEIKELEDTYPLDVDGSYISDNHCYKWYKVNNTEEWETIRKAYNMGDYGYLKSYPEIICVEHDNWSEETWIYLLSDMRVATECFWKKHGFDIEFKER